MKKIFLILALIATLIMLTGCDEAITDQYGNTRYIKYGFVEIKEIITNEQFGIVYDPETKVCYIIVSNGIRSGISPYYIINDTGIPEIAVYGMNYFGD